MNIDDIMELARLKGRVIALEAELESEKAAHKALRASFFIPHVPSEEYEKLKAEVERLHEKADIETLMTTPCSRLLRAERKEVARLKAEVDRLTKELEDEKTAHSNIENRQQDHLRGLSMENFNLKAKVERLTKAGIAMGMALPDTDEANAAYRSFERVVRS